VNGEYELLDDGSTLVFSPAPRPSRWVHHFALELGRATGPDTVWLWRLDGLRRIE
jgi:hypothetical protein